MLRFAGPAKAQFRKAAASVTIGECTIQQDQQAIVRLDVANRDPAMFPDPHRLQFDRRGPSHLAFGAGFHACVGSAPIRSAASVATKTLLDRFHFAGHTAVPVDCFAMRYLKSLTAILTSIWR